MNKTRWNKNVFHYISRVLIVSVLVLTACAKPPKPLDTTAMVQESIYNQPPPKTSEGSLWPGDNSSNILFSDTKARNVGDVITVLIDESATSAQSATTGTSKDSEIDIQTNTILGLPTNLGIDNLLGSADPFDPSVNASTSRSTDGAGTTTRQGSLTGILTVMVTEVYPNGNLAIAGSRVVTVNYEQQIMNLKGVVRPIDVSFDNTVSSRFIANASITYAGDGVVADEQRVGWFMRILSAVWPF